ncbi:uncharacterized protein [Eurosta solidaginis]|uniref:uncharacterized protein n=1 Tax=Eurosta solidaginis TaxID=178769 RepID=UPI0035309C87
MHHIRGDNLLIKLLMLMLMFSHQLAYGRPQDLEDLLPVLRNGRYVPQLYGADRGKYVPDDSGTYHHVHLPYEGGYGDRGLAYVHIEPKRGPTGLGGLSLGPKDHLRFSVDFNFNNNGWQIVQLEYINDDDEKQRYDYKYERQLWPVEEVPTAVDESDRSNATSEPVAQPVGQAAPQTTVDQTPSTKVRVSGEYQDDYYNVAYKSDNNTNAISANVQEKIGVVLDYIQKSILPTLS